MDDWGSVCGEIRFEQGEDDPNVQGIAGCLSSCDHDGCNKSQSTHHGHVMMWWAVIMSVMFR